MKLREGEEQAQRAAKWAIKRIKAKREAKAFGLAHGKSHMFVNDILKSPDPTWSRLHALADWLGMTVEELMAEAKDDKEMDVGRLQRPLVKPAIYQTALSRLKNLTEVGPLEIGDDLAGLDEERYLNPVDTLNRLQALTPFLPKPQLPFALGIAASCYRLMLEFGAGADCAELASRFAAEQANPLGAGNVLQRWVYLLSDVGLYRSALGRNIESHDYFITSGSMRRLGESVVDKAYCLLKLKNYEGALRSARTAEQFEKFVALRHNISRCMTSSMALVSLDRPGEAKDACLTSLRLAENHGNEFFFAKSLWILGIVEHASGRNLAARAEIQKAATLFQTSNPAEALLAKLDLCQVLLAGGALIECRATIESLPYEPFRDVPPILDALEDLRATARLHRLNSGVLEEVAVRVEASRADFYRARAA